MARCWPIQTQRRKPLPDGNILISCRLQDRVIVINRQGKILRQITGFLHGQHNPNPIADGDMLIADSGADRILEVNRKNPVDWVFGGQQNGSDIQPAPRCRYLLPDGNLLITDSDHNRMLEVTHSKRIVRQWTNLARPYAAVPLPNGNILVGGVSGAGVAELTQSDKVVWRSDVCKHLWASLSGLHTRSQRQLRAHDPALKLDTELLEAERRALLTMCRPGRRAIMIRDGHIYMTVTIAVESPITGTQWSLLWPDRSGGVGTEVSILRLDQDPQCH